MFLLHLDIHKINNLYKDSIRDKIHYFITHAALKKEATLYLNNNKNR